MSDKCKECGRNFGILYKKHKLVNGKVVCYECLNKQKDLPEFKDTKNIDKTKSFINEIQNFKKRGRNSPSNSKSNDERNESYENSTRIII